jgi:Leucine-rich repeat (LRR) protein
LGCHEFLNLGNSRVLKTPERLGSLVWLTELRLSEIDFERIPASIKHLTKLSKLYLDDCKRLQCLPELPSTLQVLIASGCISLKSVASIFMQGDREYKAVSQEFNFSECLQLDQNSHFRIMGAAHLRIRRMATSLFYQVNSSSLDLDLFKEKNHDNFLYVSHIVILFGVGICW